jgi:hypothetical protein
VTKVAQSMRFNVIQCVNGCHKGGVRDAKFKMGYGLLKSKKIRLISLSNVGRVVGLTQLHKYVLH